MEILGCTESGSIDAIIDGVRMTVPDEPANRHRQMIAEWEAAGNTIPAYVPPEPTQDEQFPPLEQWRFWAVVEISGIGKQALYDAVALVPDAAFKAIAAAKLNNPPGSLFYRSDPLFANAFLLDKLNQTSASIDALWAQAHQL